MPPVSERPTTASSFFAALISSSAPCFWFLFRIQFHGVLAISDFFKLLVRRAVLEDPKKLQKKSLLAIFGTCILLTNKAAGYSF